MPDLTVTFKAQDYCILDGIRSPVRLGLNVMHLNEQPAEPVADAAMPSGSDECFLLDSGRKGHDLQS